VRPLIRSPLSHHILTFRFDITMKPQSTAAALLALLIPSSFAETIIVNCNTDEATQTAIATIKTAGGDILYEYHHVGYVRPSQRRTQSD